MLGLLPPLCMFLFALIAPLARRRLGEERGLLWASVVLVAGVLLRMLGMPGLYAGAIVVSLATAVVNVPVPVFVRARFSHSRVGAMMGVYALSMGVDLAIVAALVAVWPRHRVAPGGSRSASPSARLCWPRWESPRRPASIGPDAPTRRRGLPRRP